MKVLVTIVLTDSRHLILAILPRERKFNQNYFLAFIAPEFGNENATAKRKLNSKQLVAHLHDSLCNNPGKIE
jgi:hypothetical protein